MYNRERNFTSFTTNGILHSLIFSQLTNFTLNFGKNLDYYTDLDIISSCNGNQCALIFHGTTNSLLSFPFLELPLFDRLEVSCSSQFLGSKSRSSPQHCQLSYLRFGYEKHSCWVRKLRHNCWFLRAYELTANYKTFQAHEEQKKE